jgi:hypothetical protein
MKINPVNSGVNQRARQRRDPILPLACPADRENNDAVIRQLSENREGVSWEFP